MKILKYNESMKNTLNYKVVAEMSDKYIGSDYLLVTTSAKELSEYLKTNLSKRNLDINEFNRDHKNIYDEEVTENDPSLELYEYQPFFLLEKDNNEYVLLDGFRRLLWYKSPEHTIQVRIYKQQNLKDSQIIKLLVYLNHFKFFSGNYYDRGFGLALKVIFDINITKFYNAFDGYLYKKELKKGYSDFDKYKKGKEKNILVKERILNEMFIPDMQFLQKLAESGKCMVNSVFGSILYNYRQKNPKQNFDAEYFIQTASQNKILNELLVKYNKTGDNDSTKSIEYTNQILEMYFNIFAEMFGEVKEETYAELKNKAKNLSDGLKKQGWIKINRTKNVYTIEKQVEEYYEKYKKSPQVKVVAYPRESISDGVVPVGIYDFEFKGYSKQGSLGKVDYIYVSKDGKYRLGGTVSYDAWHFRQAYNKIENVKSDYLNKDRKYAVDCDTFLKFD